MTSSTLPQWQNDILKALQLNQHKPESRYVQMATVNLKGLPEVRTVVFRGFIDNSCLMVIHTDLRSDKVAQLNTQSNIEFCWYLTETREQFRITARAELIDKHNVDHRALRAQHWSRLSEAAKSSYFWPQPGQSIGLNQPEFEGELMDNSCSLDQVSEHFMLIILHPQSVDHLQLTSPLHQRHIHYLSDNTWHQMQVTP